MLKYDERFPLDYEGALSKNDPGFVFRQKYKHRRALDQFRHCVEGGTANCPYVSVNRQGTWCCTIDNIVQVKHFGCTPVDVISKIDKES